MPYATRTIEEEPRRPNDNQLMDAFFKQTKPTCKKIPCTTSIRYDVAKLDGPKKKILEFNAELGSLDSQELIYFETMLKVLGAPQNYHRTEVSPQQVKVLEKLLQFPLEKAFPCMDLFRVYLLHPSSYEPFAASDAGAPLIQAMLRFISSPENPKALLMLTLRGLSNLFVNQSSQHVAHLNRQRIVDAVNPHLTHADRLVRQAAISMLLNYSVEFLVKDDAEGRVQIMSALAACLPQETDLQNLLRIAIALGNLAHGNAEAASLLTSMGLQWPSESQWVSASGEGDIEANKQTIREIKAMLAA